MAAYDRPRLQLLVGDRDVTERGDAITFSSTDSGGFEIATLGLPAADRPKKGTPIAIRQGLEMAWQGRVAEISDHSQHGHATRTTGCEGYRALLRDTVYSMVYVDRDLTQWGSPSLARQIVMAGASQQLGSSTVANDVATGFPALVQEFDGSWVANFTERCEALYDAGPNNLIASVFYDVISPGTVLVTTDQINFASTDALGGAIASANVYTTTGIQRYNTPSSPRRYANAVKSYITTPGGSDGAKYITSWRNIAVYGTHGITGVGGDPVGFYPSQIVGHALSQCTGIQTGAIIDATGFIVPHLVYRTATPADTVIDDMAKLMGWTWGVWEPPTMFDLTPRLDFRPPPTDATCVISKAECDQLDVTTRIGDLYNVAEISYTDPAKGLGVATVTLPNPQLNEIGIAQRTLILDMGTGTLAGAQLFGQFALLLSQVAARAAGQATLPVSVRLAGGGSKPACLLRPGIDRLRITDLIDGGPMFDFGAVRRDVFRISRAETSVAVDGSMSTRVDLDNGTNLLEVLQARLQTSVGLGASSRG